jgi:8-amino-7-oxononanoate synthase
MSLPPGLAALRAAGLYRERRLLEAPPRPGTRLADGRAVTAFCSNDYLGLSAHPAVVRALQHGAEQYGLGAGAAHLISGHCRAHAALEEELAAFCGRPRALLFATGYMANLGVVQALAGRGDSLVADRLNHASLNDAARLSGARLLRYAHADAGQAERRLAQAAHARLLLTDGVFSMDGDVAPLPALATAARTAGVQLVVDDAHGIGVLGAQGRGSLEHCGLGMAEVPVLVGTLGKALGTFGAFVAGSEGLIETLIQHARPYRYTTAPPPALAEATREALRLAQSESWRREQVLALSARLRAGAVRLGLPVAPSCAPIMPLLLGSAARALAAQQALLARGLLVQAIRPPTVPARAARLRITLSALHTAQQVDELLDALSTLLPLLPLDESDAGG